MLALPVYIYIYTCVYIYVCIYIYRYVCIYVYVYIHIYIYIGGPSAVGCWQSAEDGGLSRFRKVSTMTQANGAVL